MYFLSYKWELMSWPSLIQHRLTHKPNANVAICEEYQIRWSLGMAGKPALLYKRPVMWHLLMLSTKLSILTALHTKVSEGWGLRKPNDRPPPTNQYKDQVQACCQAGVQVRATGPWRPFMMLPDPNLSGNSKYKALFWWSISSTFSSDQTWQMSHFVAKPEIEIVTGPLVVM